LEDWWIGRLAVFQSINKSISLPIYQFSVSSLALSLIGVGADDILGDGDAVFRLAVSAKRFVGVLVALLFVRGTVTLHGTLAFILVGLFRDAWLNGHL
jgi:hypothetical protein